MAADDSHRSRWATPVALAVVLLAAAGLIGTVIGPLLYEGRDIPFQEWYGDWPMAAGAVALFVAFLLGFVAAPKGRRGWRDAGLGTAFFVALFTEMFGLPLTIYFLSALVDLRPALFGHRASHLWAFLLDRLGILPLASGVYLVMVLSTLLIAAGVIAAALGWRRIYPARGRLVTDGIYGIVRHPQYLGFLLVIAGFLIQWPTILTLIMAPVLFVVYTRLARREETQLIAAFGAEYRRYMARVGGFFPKSRAMAESER